MQAKLCGCAMIVFRFFGDYAITVCCMGIPVSQSVSAESRDQNDALFEGFLQQVEEQ